MATLSEILRWVTGTVLDRTPERDEIPRGADLAAWQPNCPDPAQAEAREAVAAMRLIGPDAEWTRDPLSAPLAPDAPDMPPVEDWRWQAMDGYEWKAMEVALRERIGADVDAVLATLESLGAIVRRPRPVFAAGLCKRAGEAVRGVFVWEAPEVHQRWLDLPEEDRPRHPLAPIIAAWLDRPREVEPERRRDRRILPCISGRRWLRPNVKRECCSVGCTKGAASPAPELPLWSGSGADEARSDP